MDDDDETLRGPPCSLLAPVSRAGVWHMTQFDHRFLTGPSHVKILWGPVNELRNWATRAAPFFPENISFYFTHQLPLL